MSEGAASGEVRGIHQERVSAWFAANVAGAVAPFRFELITGGHSNLTYQCRRLAREMFVLRRPPLGHVLESAHDMGREHKIIAALARTRCRSPRRSDCAAIRGERRAVLRDEVRRPAS